MFFKIPTEVYIEKNAISKYKYKINKYGKKCMIVTGFNSSKINGSLNDLINVFNELKIEYIIYDKIKENPLTEAIIDASIIANRSNVDFFVGLGGGSSIDASKAISLLAKNKRFDEEFLYKNEEASYFPIIAIPTTCGTGSEVTGVSVLSVRSKGTKIAIAHKVFPSLALLDYRYLKTLPYDIIKNTSIDALAHFYESYINSNATTISRAIVASGLALWSKCKNALLNDSYNDACYENLLISSMLAGMAIAHTGTSLAHGLSYLITYENNIPHGKAVGYYLSEFIKKSDCYNEILSLSGFNNINELNDFLNKVLGNINISKDLLKKSANNLFENKEKLKSCPYEVCLDTLYEISKI